MKKAEKEKWFNKLIAAIEKLIHIYEDVYYKYAECPLCTICKASGYSTEGCKNCPNKIFGLTKIYQWEKCPAIHRNSRAMTISTRDLNIGNNKQIPQERTKAHKFWSDVRAYMLTNKVEIIRNMKSKETLFNKRTKLAKAIKAMDDALA